MKEQSFQLPEGWVMTQLSRILDEFETGTRPKGGVSRYKDGTPSLGAEHLNNDGGFKFEKIKFVPKEFADSMKRGHLEEGDILVVKDGATTGKTSILGSDFPYKKAVINEHVFRCKVNENISSRYVFYYLLSNKGKQEILSDFRGAAQGGISKGFVDKVNLPLPGLSTQKIIVAKIEELFSHIDAGIESLKTAQEKLKQYRQSVLKAAVTGELTKEWREQNSDNIEPADQLLKRIQTERRQRWEQQKLAEFQAKGKPPKNDKWKETYKEPIDISEKDFSELKKYSIPSLWTLATINQITSLVTDGEHSTPKKEDSGIHLLSARNVQNGYISFDKVDYISQETHEKLSKRLKIRHGDVLLSCSGSLGRSCVVPPNSSFSLVRSVAVLRPIFIESEFLSKAIRSVVVQSQIDKKKTQTAQANIFQGKIKTIVVPIPSLEEQKEVVQIVEEKLSSADRLMKEIETKLTQAQQQKQTILASAFKGDLI